jgi:hypothetical protein
MCAYKTKPNFRIFKREDSVSTTKQAGAAKKEQI